MFDRATWKGIAIGVVSTAIGLYIVDPFVRYLPSTVLRIADAISQKWADEIFKNAAHVRIYDTIIFNE